MSKNIQTYVSQLMNNSEYSNQVYYRIVKGKYPQDYKVISITKLDEFDYRESCFHDDIKYENAEEALKVMNEYVTSPSNFEEAIFESKDIDIEINDEIHDEDREEFLNFILNDEGLNKFLNDSDHILYVFSEISDNNDSSINEEIINQYFHEIPSLQLKFFNGKLHQEWIIWYDNEILKKEWRIVPSEWEDIKEK